MKTNTMMITTLLLSLFVSSLAEDIEFKDLRSRVKTTLLEHAKAKDVFSIESRVNEGRTEYRVELISEAGEERILHIDDKGVFLGFEDEGSEEEGDEGRLFPFDFNRMPLGVPTGWAIEQTAHKGETATWSIIDLGDDNHALGLTKTNHKSDAALNLCLFPGLHFEDGRVSVRLRAESGVLDQGGGLVWRVCDSDHYWICRFNPLESNLRLYYVSEGIRTIVASAEGLSAPVGRWVHLIVDHEGDTMRVWMSTTGKPHPLKSSPVLVFQSEKLSGGGGVGLWTRTDAVTSFDDFEVLIRRGHVIR